LKTALWRVSAIVLVTIAAAGCKPAAEDGKASKVEGTPPRDPGVVIVDKAIVGQLEIETLARGTVRQSLRIPGRVALDERHVARLGANATGRVTDVRVVVGQVVKAGEVLAAVHSSEQSSAQFSLLKAKADVDFTDRSVARARQLYEADVISLAELQRRENELRVAAAQLRAAEAELRVFGLTDAEIRRIENTGEVHATFFLKSNIAGTVVERSVSRGQVVQPSDKLITVADLSRVWVVAEVPEQDSSTMTVGQQVEIEIPALAQRRISTQLAYVAETVNPETRTVLVRTEVANDGHLKPEMLATLVIAGGSSDALLISGEAVVNEDGKDHVFVEVAPGRYKYTLVELGEERDGVRVVLGGLKAGQRVVTHGAFHLNGERRKEALGG
jgi:cobalt-zinc-cadmium efflux system membrane fusion protein